MADWAASMEQTFEFYEVDPVSWLDKTPLQNILSCSISYDESDETLGNASFECEESIGEYYVRVYLVVVQNGVREKFALGTFLIQTPAGTFDGKSHSVSIDAYSPLVELKEKMTPIGYAVLKNQSIMQMAYQLCRENLRAPVVAAENTETTTGNFVANLEDNWLTFLRDFIASANYHFLLDEVGRVLFAAKQDVTSLQPVWTYEDDNSSILYPEIEMEQDLYGIPNVVEVVYSQNDRFIYARAVNNDENSPVSTVNRKREVVYRETDPSMIGNPTQQQLNDYATQLLRDLSSLECTITYTHGYCPVRVGDCVRLNYTRAGIVDIKAKVIRQSIKCEPGCPVTETAVYVNKYWG